MAEKEAGMHQHEQRFVWVKDKAGNEYVCRVMDLSSSGVAHFTLMRPVFGDDRDVLEAIIARPAMQLH